MGDTTSNHDRLIMNKGSNATAKDTVPDVCFNASWVPVGYPNTAPLDRLGANKTTKTTIKDKEICVLGTLIGPPSDAAHDGINRGVISGTYRGWATAITFSPDVFAEGRPVVRLDDLTVQNNCNTLGKIIAGQHTAHKESYADYGKKKCNLQKLTGVCDHGRQLGWLDQKNWGTGEAEYLEILIDDKVTLEVERFDITEEPNVKSPACEKNHTKWTAEIVTFPTRSKETKEHNGDDWVVEANWAIDKIPEIIQLLMPQAKGEGEMKVGPKDHSYTPQDEARDRANMKNFNLGTPAQREAAIQDNHERARQAQDQERRTSRAVSLEVDITDMFKLFAWIAMPPTIDVKAVACSAGKKLTVKVYPKDEFKFSFQINRKVSTRSPMAKIRAGILAVRNATNIAKKVLAIAGQRFECAFLEGFKFEWVIQYKEHTKFAGALTRVYTPATVGQDWTMEIASDPLLKLGTKVVISLADFLGPVGRAAASIARRVGVKVDLEFGAEVEVAIAFVFGWDEYKEMKSGMAKFTITLKFFAAIIAAAAGVEIQGKIEFPATGSVFLRNSTKPGCLAQWNKEWSIKTHISVTAKFWRWFSWKAYDGWPASWAHVEPMNDNAWGDLFTTAN